MLYSVDLTPFDLETEENWSAEVSKEMESAQIAEALSMVKIPSYGLMGDQDEKSMREIQLRMERMAYYHQAETAFMKVEVITRELEGKAI